MALSDKNILITPNIGQSADPKIEFKGADASTAAQTITLQVYPTDNGTLSFEGSAGQLFSITNSLSGTIYSVNDVSGIPSIEVLDTGLIKLGQYGGNVLLGTGTDNGSKLQVAGTTALGTNLANYLTVTGAASASAVSITTAGSDTNIGLNITTKGAGSIIIDTGTGVGDIDLKPGSAALRIYDDDSSNYFRLLTGNTAANYDLSFPAATGTFLIANSTANTAGYFDTGTTTPTGTTRLNYSGYFYPTYINLSGSSDTTTAASHYFIEQSSDGYVRPKPLANVQSEIVTNTTVNTASALTAGSTSAGFIKYNGTTATAGQWDGGTTTPTGTTRLNYGGYIYPTALNLVGQADTATAATHYFVETATDGYVRPKTLANVQSEVVTTAVLGSGSASSTTYLRGDRTWATISGGATLANDTTTNSNAYYPAMAYNATSGAWATAYVSSTKYYFNPSTGTLNATIFNSLSDINHKKNIVVISNATEIINKLNGVEFEWIDNGLKSSGVIAQEVEAVLPHLISEADDGTKTVNYSGIIAYLIESNKELLRRIEQLEAK